MGDYRTFLIPYDFSDPVRAALFAGVDLARRLGADVHLVHVIQPPAYTYAGLPGTASAAATPLGLNDEAARSLDDVAASLDVGSGSVTTHVLEGMNVAAIVCEAAEKLAADLIVMGTHGRTGLAHAFLGSVAERTVRQAPCPVLTVRAPEEA